MLRRGYSSRSMKGLTGELLAAVCCVMRGLLARVDPLVDSVQDFVGVWHDCCEEPYWGEL